VGETNGVASGVYELVSGCELAHRPKVVGMWTNVVLRETTLVYIGRSDEPVTTLQIQRSGQGNFASCENISDQEHEERSKSVSQYVCLSMNVCIEHRARIKISVRSSLAWVSGTRQLLSYPYPRVGNLATYNPSQKSLLHSTVAS
jgi:hypothetical protein